MNQYNENKEKNGYWEHYFYNGKLSYKGNYINHKQNGYWEYYNLNDKLSYKTFHI